MRLIDRLIERSKAFKNLEDRMTSRMNAMLTEHVTQSIDREMKQVDKIVDLTTRVHNTIIGFKHSKTERLVP